MKTAIFVRTCLKDLEYFKMLCASIKKFASGFSEVAVVSTQVESRSMIRAICFDNDFTLHGDAHQTSSDNLGYLHQQVTKVYADQYCAADTDFILYIDSDCVFTAPVTPETYSVFGKPDLCYERYSDFKKERPDRYKWQEVVERTLGFPPDFETMCRHPSVYPVQVLKSFRDHIKSLFEEEASDYIMKQEPGFRNGKMPGFTEFNTLGAYARQYCPSFFNWINVRIDGRPTDYVYQAWSHRPPTNEDKAVWQKAGLI